MPCWLFPLRTGRTIANLYARKGFHQVMTRILLGHLGEGEYPDSRDICGMVVNSGAALMAEWSGVLRPAVRCRIAKLGLPWWPSGLVYCAWLFTVELPDWGCPDGRVVWCIAPGCSLSNCQTGAALMAEWSGVLRLAVHCRIARLGLPWWPSGLVYCAWLFTVELPGWGCPDGRVVWCIAPGYSLSNCQTGAALMAEWSGVLRLAVHCRIAKLGLPWWPSGLVYCAWLFAVELPDWGCPDGRVVWCIAPGCSLSNCQTGAALMAEWSGVLRLAIRCRIAKLGLPWWPSGLVYCAWLFTVELPDWGCPDGRVVWCIAPGCSLSNCQIGTALMAEWSGVLRLAVHCRIARLGLPWWPSGLVYCAWLFAVELPNWGCPDGRVVWCIAPGCSLSDCQTGAALMAEWSGVLRLAVHCRIARLGLPWWRSGLVYCAWLFPVELPDWSCPDGRVVWCIAPGCSLSNCQTGAALMAEWSGVLRLAVHCRIARLGLPWWPSGLVYCAWLFTVELPDWGCPDGRVVWCIAPGCSLSNCQTGAALMAEWSGVLRLAVHCRIARLGLPWWPIGLVYYAWLFTVELPGWGCPDGRVVWCIAPGCSLWNCQTGAALMAEWSGVLRLAVHCRIARLGLPWWPSGLVYCAWLFAVELPNWGCPDGRVVWCIAPGCSLSDCQTGAALMAEWSGVLRLAVHCRIARLGLPWWPSGLVYCAWLFTVELPDWGCPDGRVVWCIAPGCSLSNCQTGAALMAEWSGVLRLAVHCRIARLGLPWWPSGLVYCAWLFTVELPDWGCPDGRVVWCIAPGCSLSNCQTGAALMAEWSGVLRLAVHCRIARLGLPWWPSGLVYCAWLFTVELPDWGCPDGRVVWCITPGCSLSNCQAGAALMAGWSGVLRLAVHCGIARLGLPWWPSGLVYYAWLFTVELPDWGCPDGRVVWCIAPGYSLSNCQTGTALMAEWSGVLRLAVHFRIARLGLPWWPSGLVYCAWLFTVELPDWDCPDGRVVWCIAPDCSLSNCQTGAALMAEWSGVLRLTVHCRIARLGLPWWPSGLVYCAWLFTVELPDWGCPDGRVVWCIAPGCSLSNCQAGAALMAKWSGVLRLAVHCRIARLGLPWWPSGLVYCAWLFSVELPDWSCPDGRVVWCIAPGCSLSNCQTGAALMAEWSGIMRLAVRCRIARLGLLWLPSGLVYCAWLFTVELPDWGCPDGRVVWCIAPGCSLSNCQAGAALMAEWSGVLRLAAHCRIARLGLPWWPSGLGHFAWLYTAEWSITLSLTARCLSKIHGFNACPSDLNTD